MSSSSHARQADAALLATSRSGHRKAPRQKAPETYDEKLAQLEELREAALHSAPEAEEKQHARGKYTARERIDKLLDPGSFQELDTFVRHPTYDFDMQKNRPWADAVGTVQGTIESRTLCDVMSHNTKSGVAHFASEDEDACLEDCRYLIGFLPQNNMQTVPRVAPTDDPQRMDPELDHVVPDNPNKPYDMRDVVRHIVDDGEFFEVHEHHAKNIICGFSRLDSYAIGVVGNQPNQLAGVLDIDASAKAARFVRTCDAFNIPLLTFVDVPGFLPGTSQEWGGIIRHGAKLLYAFTEATVPKLTVITRKAYGGAYDVMASKHMLADFNFAWPTSEVAVMGPEGAVNIIYRRDIAGSPTPQQRREKLMQDYKARFANPYTAAERGYIDDVIVPHETRRKLVTARLTLQTKS